MPNPIQPRIRLLPAAPIKLLPTLPPVWGSLEPHRQKQLAQHLARLIHRLRSRISLAEEVSHDEPA
jgi:hypothetical protein